jgi:hypothetical protein
VSGRGVPKSSDAELVGALRVIADWFWNREAATTGDAADDAIHALAITEAAARLEQLTALPTAMDAPTTENE